MLKLRINKYLSIAALCLASSNAVAANYKLDESHTQIMFKVRHLGISSVTGTFENVSGSIQFDKDKISESKADAKITLNGITTSNQKRDDHLKSPDFFDSKKFPEISFKTTSIKDVEGNTFTAVGELTIKDTTKPIELKAEFTGDVKDPWGNERIAFTAEGKLNRKDYGLTWNKILETGGLAVGEEVKISIEAEAIKEK